MEALDGQLLVKPRATQLESLMRIFLSFGCCDLTTTGTTSVTRVILCSLSSELNAWAYLLGLCLAKILEPGACDDDLGLPWQMILTESVGAHLAAEQQTTRRLCVQRCMHQDRDLHLLRIHFDLCNSGVAQHRFLQSSRVHDLRML